MKSDPQYKVKDDLTAAMTVAIFLIPQGMAYALLAGLPPVYGLYTAIFPTIIYGLFGSSRQLSVGPAAVVSILVFASIAPLAEPFSMAYIVLVIFLTLVVGLIQMLLAVLRVGGLMRFVPQGVIRGFISAIAVTIILNQVGQFVDISFNRDAPFFYALFDLLRHIPEANNHVLFFSFLLLILFFIIKKINILSPTLLFIIISTVLVAFFSLDQWQIKTVGHVPHGLPLFKMPVFIKTVWVDLLPIAILIAFISFLESFAMANALSKKSKETIDPNQELFALGLANVIGSFFSAFPVAGALSRSAINAQAGARTGLSSMFAALYVILVLSFFTEAFTYLPLSALALIIMVAAKNLVDLPKLSLNRTMTKEDWLIILTFLSALSLGLQQGFFVGMVLSCLILFFNLLRKASF